MPFSFPESLLGQVEAGRASYAFNKVKQGVVGEKWGKEYKSYVQKLPMLIKVNGLAAALAFAKANSGEESERKRAWKALYGHIASWLQKINGCSPQQELMDWVVNLPIPEYRLVENEVLALLNWLKRFAEGLVPGEAK